MIAREIKDRQSEGHALGNLGLAYGSLGNYAKAIEYEQQSLVLAREIKDRQSEGKALGNLGNAYDSLGNYAKAIEYQQQSLVIAREIKDRQGEGKALGNLGVAYYSLGNYAKAIEYYQQFLVIAREIKDRQSEGKALGNLGLAYGSLGDYAKAIEYEQQLLVIAREIKDRQGEGAALGNLGVAYESLGNYAKAIEYQQQWLVIAREIYDRQSEGAALGNLGNAYKALGNYAKAIEYQQQSLVLAREIKDRQREGVALGSLGLAYISLGNYAKAIEYEQQSLAIAQEIGDRKTEGIVLSKIGEILEKQKQPELAIIFYKQSVSVRELIRQYIRQLPREQQESYIQSVAETYRSLANLLLYQSHLLEAQQVLELLKIQELHDYVGNSSTTSGVPLNPLEQTISAAYTDKIALDGQLARCEQTRCPQRPQLIAQQSAANEKITVLVEHLIKLSRDQANKNVRQSQVTTDISRVVNARSNTLLINYLVRADKVNIVWATQNRNQGVVVASATCPLSETRLNALISTLHDNLINSREINTVQSVSQELYNCLIKPFEPELNKLRDQAQHNNTIPNLIFIADRNIRKIPMEFLFDGKNI